MNGQNTTALIIHGYGLHHSDWYSVMWGDIERGLLGRAPMGVLISYRRRPDLIIWNTGATEKEGQREADHTLQYTLMHITELPGQFAEFQHIDTEELAAYLRRVSVTEVESMRTSDAFIQALRYLTTQDGHPLYTEVMQVTSKNHAPRVLRDSVALWWEQRGLIMVTSVYPAQTGYSGGTSGEIQIRELISEKEAPFGIE